MFQKSIRKMQVGIVLLVVVVMMTVALVAAPQSVATACEPAGGICNCPGC